MTATATERTTDLVTLPHGRLMPWPGLNPRKRFSEDRIREVAASIAQHGILQNLVVHDTGEDVLWIVAGETRWRSARVAEEGCAEIGLEPAGEIPIPCRVRHFEEGEALAIAMLENMQRGNLTAIEEAEGFARLIALNNWTQSKLAEEILGDHRRQSYVAHRLRLLELPAEIRELIEEGHINASQARDSLLPLTRMEEGLPEVAFARVLEAIRAMLALDAKIEGAWLEQAAARAREDVERELGSKDLFGGETVQAAKEEPVPAPAVVEDEPITISVPITADELDAAFDGLLRDVLAPSGTALRTWEAIAADGAEDDTILGNVGLAVAVNAGRTIELPEGACRVESADPPQLVLTVPGYADLQLQEEQLANAVRRVFVIPQPGESAAEAGETAPAVTQRRYATWELERGYDAAGRSIPEEVLSAFRARLTPPAPAEVPAPEPPAEVVSAPAPEEAPAAAPVVEATPAPAVEEPIVEKPAPTALPKAKPAPAAPASTPAAEAAPIAQPLAVLSSPDAGRAELPEGAGLIAAILAATGRRPGTISYTPIPDGRIAVTVAPRLLKAGEKPFALTGTAEELDSLLVAAIDSHFTI